MINKNYFLIMLIIILNCITITASSLTQDYFIADDGLFNEKLDDYDIIQRNLVDADLYPIIIDSDNDGNKEVIILDNGFVKFYNPNDLSVEFSHNLGDYDYTSQYFYDYDGDNLTELFYIDNTNKKLLILKYNGTNIHQRNISIGYDDVLLTACEDINKCIVFSSARLTLPIRYLMAVTVFNSTDVIHLNVEIENTDYTSHAKQVQTGSINIRNPYIAFAKGGGYNLFVGTFMYPFFGASAKTFIVRINESNNYPILYTSLLHDYRGTLLNTNVITKTDLLNNNNQITAPYTQLIEGTIQDYYIMIGERNSVNNYRIQAYTTSLAKVRQFPLVQNSDGVMLSNIIPSNAFTDVTSDNKDFCVLGYDNTDSRMVLTCGSFYTGQSPATREFTYDYTGSFNISNLDVWTTAIYSVNTKQDEQSPPFFSTSKDLSEFVTPYGIFELKYTSILERNELNLIFPRGYSENSHITLKDAQNTGYSDMYVLTTSYLILVDDKYINSDGKIDDYEINPCIDAIIKVNETMSITIIPRDSDGDKVRARAKIYANSIYEQDSNWSAYQNSGTPFVFYFKVNVTGSNHQIKMYATDESNPSNVDEITLTFPVGTNGVTYGSCTTKRTGIIDDTITDEEQDSTIKPLDVTENVATEIVNNFADATGLGSTITWLLFMIAIAFVIFIWDRDSHGLDDRTRFMIITFVEILMFIVGAMIGVISSGLIWIMVLLALIGGGFWISNKFFNPNKNNGV